MSGPVLDWITSLSTAMAVIVALGGYGILEWQRRESLRSNRRTSAHMIGIRLFRLLNHSCGFEKHLAGWEGQNEPHANALLPPVHPLVGIAVDQATTLERDEISLLIEAHEAAFLTELMLAAAVYESMVISMNEYRERYETLYRMMPPPVSMNGKIAAHNLSGEEVLKLKPYSIQLFELVDALHKMTKENVERCKTLGNQYHPMMKKRFKGEKFISFGSVERA